MRRNTATWVAFLLAAFAVVGMMGVFASYAAPLPLERAMARDAALDEALATGGSKAQLEPLRDRLDDSAALVIDGSGPLPDRVATARAAMHAELRGEAETIGDRVRFELLVVTVVAGAFGALVLGTASRAAA